MIDDRRSATVAASDAGACPRRGLDFVVGVASHRNPAVGEIPQLRACVREFLQRLRRAFPRLQPVLVSALAEGGDQLVAEEALAAGYRLVAPLPLARAEYERDFADAASRERFTLLCAQASVIEAHAGFSIDPHGPLECTRDWHYAQAGAYIASHCHLLLAIWDGKPAAGHGGTAQVIDYYLRGHRPRVAGHADPDADGLCLIEGHETRLAWHLACSREQVDGEPAPPLRPLQTQWLQGESAWPDDSTVPAAFAAMLDRIATLDEDLRWQAAQARPSADAASAPEGIGSGLFTATDALALHYRRRTLFALRAMHAIAALMAFAFVLYDNLDQTHMIFGFLLLFGLGVLLDAIATRRQWQRRHLDYRALAEGLRVQWHWQCAGVPAATGADFAHDGFLLRQDSELGWIRNVMRAEGLRLAEAGIGGRDLRTVIDEWIGDDTHGQLHYYAQGLAARSRQHHATEVIGAWTLWSGIAICVLLAVFAFRVAPQVRSLLVAAMAVLSITAAVRQAYAWRKADRELIRQYGHMLSLYRRARRALDSARDPVGQRAILRVLGEAALVEHAEWALRHRERPLERART